MNIFNIPKVLIDALQTSLKASKDEASKLSVAGIKTTTACGCSLCLIHSFTSVEEQRAHFKSDLHVFALRKRFNEGIGDFDCEEKECEQSVSDTSDFDTDQRKHDRRLYLPTVGWIFKNVIFPNSHLADKTDENLEEALAALSLLQISNENHSRFPYWCIILLSGGRLAAAVFDNSENAEHGLPVIVKHKTLQRYTVRKKQGGGQSARDGQQGGSKPKSIGASIRRENEKLLTKDIERFLLEWRGDIDRCSRIFVHAPGQFNQQMLYGDAPLLSRKDVRVRSVPLAVIKKPTQQELKRIYVSLSHVICA